jgi:hypothetical protein
MSCNIQWILRDEREARNNLGYIYIPYSKNIEAPAICKKVKQSKNSKYITFKKKWTTIGFCFYQSIFSKHQTVVSRLTKHWKNIFWNTTQKYSSAKGVKKKNAKNIIL